MTLGLLKSIDMAIRMPHSRNASAMRAIWGRKSSSKRWGFALTLLIAQPLIPREASKRAYSRTRVKSGRTLPPSKKNGASSISPFDPTIEVVPLVHPAQWSIRLLDFVQSRDTLVAGHFAQQCEHAVQHAAVSCRRNNEARKSSQIFGRQPKTFFAQRTASPKSR